MDKVKILYKNVADLLPYENNPRINDGAVDAVAASIKEFGFKVPIVVDSDGVIVTGHTRLKAAKKLGMESVPVIVADDLTPEQVKAFRLADNKTSELAQWDLDKLEIELDGIDEIDMSDFGFADINVLDEETDDMEPIDDDGIGGTLAQEHKMRIDNTVIVMTEEENTLIRTKLEQYLDANGVSYGFVGWLVNGD